ncbi:MAG: hypothetical protein ACFFB0_02095 [Promethearchaeota archaeon]
MSPPICGIFDKKLANLNDGGKIYFKKRLSDIEWDKKRLKKLEDYPM